MKKKIINTSVLASNVPPPSKAFAPETMARLHAMAAEEEKPMKRKLSTSLVIAALIIVLLAATAMAIGLRRSAEADAVVLARQALMEDYGLTNETIGCFFYTAEEEGGGWVVTFEGAAWELERLGTYTVRLNGSKAAETSWTHDDVDPAIWQGGDMEAPAWGQLQLLERLRQQGEWRESMANRNWEDKSFEAAAENLPRLFLDTVDDETLRFERLIPTDEDIPVEQVVSTAREIIASTYGIDEEALSAYSEEVAFAESVESAKDGVRQYIVIYEQWDPVHGGNTVFAQIASPSGEVLACTWLVENQYRTLPDGPLDAYAQAVEEFVQTGTLEERSAEEKAETVQRIRDAGLESLLADTHAYVLPGEQDLSETEAIKAADKALAAAYEIGDDAMTLLGVRASLVDTASGRTWELEYLPKPPLKVYDWLWNEINGKIGTYRVETDAATGDIRSASWSHDGAEDETEYTEHTWGEAPVYPGIMLDWVKTLRDNIDAIQAKYPDDVDDFDYSREDAAAYDTYYREAGFSATQFSRSMPGEGDISYEEAFALARAAILAEMPHVEEIMGDVVRGEYSLYDSEVPAWRFSWFFVDDNGIEIDFGVSIDAKTGEILSTGLITGGNG